MIRIVISLALLLAFALIGCFIGTKLVVKQATLEASEIQHCNAVLSKEHEWSLKQLTTESPIISLEGR